MENKSNDKKGEFATHDQHSWQQDENKTTTEDSVSFDLRSAEANGYGVESDAEIQNTASILKKKYQQKLSSDFTDEDQENNSEEEDSDSGDWGNVDPLSGDRSPDDEPTAPGSAV